MRARHDTPQSLLDRSIVTVMSLAFVSGIAIAAGLAAWLVLVPNRLTIADFSWVTVLALMMMFTGAVVSLRARATRSIAHVLYETEHPSVRHL